MMNHQTRFTQNRSVAFRCLFLFVSALSLCANESALAQIAPDDSSLAMLFASDPSRFEQVKLRSEEVLRRNDLLKEYVDTVVREYPRLILTKGQLETMSSSEIEALTVILAPFVKQYEDFNTTNMLNGLDIMRGINSLHRTFREVRDECARSPVPPCGQIIGEFTIVEKILESDDQNVKQYRIECDAKLGSSVFRNACVAAVNLRSASITLRELNKFPVEQQSRELMNQYFTLRRTLNLKNRKQ